MRIITFGLVAAVAGLGGMGAWADEPAPSPEQLRETAEKDLDARVAKLLGMARKAFQAQDYESSRRLSYAAWELRPGNPEAREIHRMSIQYGERLNAAKQGPPGRGESVDQALDRLSGPRTIPWARIPEGAGVKPSESPKPAEKPAWQAAVEKKLSEKGTVEFKDTKFAEVKEYLEAFLGCPVVVDRRLRDKVSALPVNFKAKDMPFEQILGWVVQNDLGLQYALVDGAVYISDADGMTEKVGVTSEYDVGDLVYQSQMPDFVPPSLDLRDSRPGPVMGIQFDAGASPEEAAPPRGLTPEKLIRAIERTVDPGTWHREGDGK